MSGKSMRETWAVHRLFLKTAYFYGKRKLATQRKTWSCQLLRTQDAQVVHVLYRSAQTNPQ